MATCARSECHRPFTKTTPWQRFCSTKCRMDTHNQRRRDHFASASALSVVDAAMSWYRTDGTFTAEEALKAACERHTKEGA